MKIVFKLLLKYLEVRERVRIFIELILMLILLGRVLMMYIVVVKLGM